MHETARSLQHMLSKRLDAISERIFKAAMVSLAVLSVCDMAFDILMVVKWQQRGEILFTGGESGGALSRSIDHSADTVKLSSLATASAVFVGFNLWIQSIVTYGVLKKQTWWTQAKEQLIFFSILVPVVGTWRVHVCSRGRNR